jgi:hypothetical protein
VNEKLKVWGILGGVSLLTISLIYLFSKPKKRKSKFKSKLISIANEEYDAWNTNGKIKEGNKDTIQRLRDYWEEGTGTKANDDYYVNTAWSSAFISYLMKKAGAGDDFKYSPSHSEYIRQAIKNRKQNNSIKIKGYKPNEVDVKAGDLVCYPRQGGVNYETTSSYMSHCDLVVSTNEKQAVTIGGNVSDSVTKTIVPLKNGKIDMSKENKGYFVVIKNDK